MPQQTQVYTPASPLSSSTVAGGRVDSHPRASSRALNLSAKDSSGRGGGLGVRRGAPEHVAVAGAEAGRGPQGVSQTSSTRLDRSICAQQRTWSTVGGSKAPPKTATRTFCDGVALLLSAAGRLSGDYFFLAYLLSVPSRRSVRW